MREEVCSGGAAADHDVVVEVNEMFGQTFNVMQTRLDGMRIEYRQAVGVGKNRLVINNAHPILVCIEPFGSLVIGNDIDPAKPRSIQPEGAQGKPQLVLVMPARGVNCVPVERESARLQSFVSLSLPFRVAIIHPSEYGIYILHKVILHQSDPNLCAVVRVVLGDSA